MILKPATYFFIIGWYIPILFVFKGGIAAFQKNRYLHAYRVYSIEGKYIS